MDVNTLIRNDVAIKAALKRAGKTVVALKPLKIHIPKNYLKNGLASISESDEGTSVKILGIHAIILDNYYCVSSACALLEIDPRVTNEVDINGTTYLEFSFDAGDTVVKTVDLVKIKTLIFRIYHEFDAMGNIPWYIGVDDACLKFQTSKLHANVNLGVDNAITELFPSTMARQKDDRTKLHRHNPKLQTEGKLKVKPVWIPLNSVAYNASNTTAKLVGNYFSVGLVSALSYPAEKEESIESLLRK